MPLRPFNREQTQLLPPTLNELIPRDHPARFVAEFVDALDGTALTELGIGLDGEPLGAPACHPRALLSVWIQGFMTGIRSSRKLEAACRDQIPFLWLTGWQYPDHNTLWRFYQAHRHTMRKLLKYTVATAIEMDLVDLAVQAVDWTKIAVNTAGDRNYDSAGLHRLLDIVKADRQLASTAIAGNPLGKEISNALDEMAKAADELAKAIRTMLLSTIRMPGSMPKRQAELASRFFD